MRELMEERKFVDGKCDGVGEAERWWGMCKLSSFRVRVRDHGSLAPFSVLIGAVGASPETGYGWVLLKNNRQHLRGQ